MYWLILIVLFAYSVFTKKNKLFSVIVLTYLGIVSIFSNPLINQDFAVYQSYYYAGEQGAGKFEKGYTLLSQLCLNLKLSYVQFRGVIVIISLIAIIVAMIRYIKNWGIFVAGYGMSIHIINTVQIRVMVALAFVILAASFMVNVSKRNMLIAFACILVAGSFHTIAYVFFIGIAIRLLLSKSNHIDQDMFKITIFSGITAIVFMLLMKSNWVLSSLVTRLSELTGRESLAGKVAEQYTQSTGRLQVAIFGVVIVLSIGFLFFLLSHIKVDENSVTIFSFSVIALLGLALLLISGNYMRIVRCAFAFWLIGFANEWGELEVTVDKKSLYFIAFLLLFLSNAYMLNFANGPEFMQTISTLTKPVFDQ